MKSFKQLFEVIGKIKTIDGSKYKEDVRAISEPVFDAIVDRKNTDVLITKVSKKFFDKMMDHTKFMIFWNMMSYDAKRKEVRIDIERPKIKLKRIK